MPYLGLLRTRIAAVFSRISRRQDSSYTKAMDSPFSDHTDWSWDDTDSSYGLIDIEVPDVSNVGAVDHGDLDEEVEISWLNRMRLRHRHAKLSNQPRTTKSGALTRVKGYVKNIFSRFRRSEADTETFQILLDEN